jgi:hypothetical protein
MFEVTPSASEKIAPLLLREENFTHPDISESAG